MHYPVRKTIIIASLAIATITMGASSISNTAAHENNKENNTVNSVASPAVPMPAPAPRPDSNIREEAGTAASLYQEMDLEEAGLSEKAFELAWTGFEKLSDEGKVRKTDLLTVIDFSQPSTRKRLYVIDIESRKILFQSVVSHGRNTGTLWAKNFSNRNGSNMSSPGFYLTAETYMGGNGYSLRLDGLEQNINHNARARAIVMHGAPYASESSIRSLGFLGRSLGCPALPPSLTRAVINTIKEGSLLFIYTPGQNYERNSTIV